MIQRSVVGQGNPLTSVLIEIDVAATPTIVRANGRSTAAWKNPVIAKMKNSGFLVINRDARAINPTK